MNVFVLGHGASEVAQRANGLVELVLLGIEVGQAHIGGESLVLFAEGKVYFGEAVEGKEIIRVGLHQVFVSVLSLRPLVQPEETLGHIALGGSVVRILGESAPVLF